MLMKSVVFRSLIVLTLGSAPIGFSQCAMCKAVVESNHNHKDQPQKVARQLNDGIIYLMLIPYIILGGIGYMFYKSRNDHNKTHAES